MGEELHFLFVFFFFFKFVSDNLLSVKGLSLLCFIKNRIELHVCVRVIRLLFFLIIKRLHERAEIPPANSVLYARINRVSQLLKSIFFTGRGM